MKDIFAVTLALILFQGVVSLAQSTPPQSSNGIAPGSIISAELVKSVDVRKVKAGDKIEAKVVVPLVSNGQVLIPKGSRIIGHVTEAKPRSKDPKGSTVGIVFDTLSTKEGQLIIQAAIQAIGPVEPAATNGIRSGFPVGISPVPPPAGVAGQPADTSGLFLEPSSQGIVGLEGLSLSRSGQTSVVTSSHDNVRLEGGTQLILRIEESL